MALQRAEIAALVAAADLVALIGQDVALVRYGRELKGLCPFHQERSPSFTVVPDKGFFHCFGCGAHGDAIGYLRLRYGVSFGQAVAWLGGGGHDLGTPKRRDLGHCAPDESRRRAYQVWQSSQPLVGSLAAVYLAHRGLSAATIGRLKSVRYGLVPYYQAVADGRPQRLGVWPCMVAAITDGLGRFQALHQTWLADDGRGKREIRSFSGDRLAVKKVRGRAGGGAIRLTHLDRQCRDLAAAEGIETAASVAQALGDGVAVWSLYSLGNLCGGGLGRGDSHPQRPGFWLPSTVPDPGRAGFVPPSGVGRLTWFADGDGQDPLAAACLIRRAAVRYERAGVELAVAQAPAGLDFNDVLQGKRP